LPSGIKEVTKKPAPLKKKKRLAEVRDRSMPNLENEETTESVAVVMDPPLCTSLHHSNSELVHTVGPIPDARDVAAILDSLSAGVDPSLVLETQNQRGTEPKVEARNEEVLEVPEPLLPSLGTGSRRKATIGREARNITTRFVSHPNVDVAMADNVVNDTLMDLNRMSPEAEATQVTTKDVPLYARIVDVGRVINRDRFKDLVCYLGLSVGRSGSLATKMSKKIQSVWLAHQFTHKCIFEIALDQGSQADVIDDIKGSGTDDDNVVHEKGTVEDDAKGA
jgi:hypothetical protein